MTQNLHEPDHGPPDTYTGRINYRAPSMNEDINARTHYPPQNSMLYMSHTGSGASIHLGVQQNYRNARTEYIPSLSSHQYVARNDPNTAFSDERNLAFWGTTVGRSDCVLNPLDSHHIASSASGNRDQEIIIPMQKVDQKGYIGTQNMATVGYSTARFSYPTTHLENVTSTNQSMHKFRYVSSGHSEVISDYFPPRESGSMQLHSKIEQSYQRRTSYYERDPLESPDGMTEQDGECDLRQKPIEGHHHQCDYHNCPNRARVLQMYGKFCNRHVIVAPCGFPGCRDKAAAKFSMCTKHISLGKEALHDVLANRAQNVPVCKTLGCFKNDQGRGYCRGHEKLLMATGRLPKHIKQKAVHLEDNFNTIYNEIFNDGFISTKNTFDKIPDSITANSKVSASTECASRSLDTPKKQSREECKNEILTCGPNESKDSIMGNLDLDVLNDYSPTKVHAHRYMPTTGLQSLNGKASRMTSKHGNFVRLNMKRRHGRSSRKPREVPAYMRASSIENMNQDNALRNTSSSVENNGGFACNHLEGDPWRSDPTPQKIGQEKVILDDVNYFLFECMAIVSTSNKTLPSSSTSIHSVTHRAPSPRCHHMLECKLVTVKKKNVNHGKSFFTCPYHVTEGQCDFFLWEDNFIPFALKQLAEKCKDWVTLDDFDSSLASNQPGLRPIQSHDSIPSQNQDLVHNLRVVFGHQDFRECQLWAIKRVSNSQDAVLILPTGAGKSLCYQFPVLFLAGIALVISPLIALMQDQYDHLPALMKQYATILSSASSMRKTDYVSMLDRLHRKELKLIYISPERATTKSFLHLLSLSKVTISLVCVDEAHCISEWSHYFRPSFLRLCDTIFPRADCILALTATASKRVTLDILTQIKKRRERYHEVELKEAESPVMRLPWYRPNLSINIVRVESERERIDHLVMLLHQFFDNKSNRGGLLIYVHRQRDAENVAMLLEQQLIPLLTNSKKSFRIASFHAGLDPAIKSRIRSQFQRGLIKIMVATIAFGMGIDKQNVRGVIHYHFPASIEAYVQQMGRAGRDQKHAFVISYLLVEEVIPRHSLLFHSSIEEKQLESLFNLLGNLVAREVLDGYSLDELTIDVLTAADEHCVVTRTNVDKSSQLLVIDLELAWLEVFVDMNKAMIQTFLALCHLEVESSSNESMGINMDAEFTPRGLICVVYLPASKLLTKDGDARFLMRIVGAIEQGKLSKIAHVERRNEGYISELVLRFPLLETAMHLFKSNPEFTLEENVEAMEQRLWHKLQEFDNGGVISRFEAEKLACRIQLELSNLDQQELQKSMSLLTSRLYRKHEQLQSRQVKRFETLYSIFQEASISAQKDLELINSSDSNSDSVQRQRQIRLEQQLTSYFDDKYCKKQCKLLIEDLIPTLSVDKHRMIVEDINELLLTDSGVEVWTSMNVTKVLHGIGSPKFPQQKWRDHKLWGKHENVAFEQILSAAQTTMSHDDAQLESRLLSSFSADWIQ
uniref:DNA 3'-5' helicase n=1 Tax=Albugo laibachii Nc14 TaxID=890382 RepID=F0W4I2_9STRA|nr:ATPdependent DNA helicase putative [Albugo laibachii Nc14]|eukprot:CCA16015.1 ATPdependent DNA helicase putative [Albugo laibachii Nc14]